MLLLTLSLFVPLSYAFDIITRGGSPFLANKRLFAAASTGIPDGIKCDLEGNVYSGCGDGLNVWSPGGSLIGKVMCPGGVANFCFTKKGEIVLLNETKFWVVSVSKRVQGALLRNMQIEVE
jgi:gluconolactonase